MTEPTQAKVTIFCPPGISKDLFSFLIGTGGAHVKALRAMFNCLVSMDFDAHTISIRGPDNTVNDCVVEVLARSESWIAGDVTKKMMRMVQMVPRPYIVERTRIVVAQGWIVKEDLHTEWPALSKDE